jgi:hypothetical protein
MNYLMQIYQGEALEVWSKLSEAEQQVVTADYQAVNQTPGVTPGKWLAAPEMATTVRVKDGQTVTTDGPFAETKEALGGYFLLEGADLDAAIALAARVPAARFGGAVEIRPLVEY